MLGKQLQTAAAGSAGGEKVYVDDVFSTYTWIGTGSVQTITNGIDLDGEGGMVWTKVRNVSDNHYFADSERGKTGTYFDELASNATYASQETRPWGITSFNSNGFSLSGSNGQFNFNGKKYCSWTFRKAPGFFDCVTWTGDGVNGRQISHALGSTPGIIIIKRTNSTSDWITWHRSLNSATKYLKLNSDDAEGTGATWMFNSTLPTSTHFTVANDGAVNGNNDTYVAYLFAHDDQSFGTDSDEAIIKCDGYTGNGTSGHEINLGFEPQWLMIKRVSGGTQNWFMFDSMRGIVTGGIDGTLRADSTADEQVADNIVELTSTGFKIINTNSVANKSGDPYVYIAIRRPHKPAEAATDVFAMDTGNSSSTIPAYDSNFPVDFAISRIVSSAGYAPHFTSRLTGTNYLRSDNDFAQQTDADYTWDSNVGWGKSWYSQYQSWMFRRAPGFFDIVCWDGDQSNPRNISHNLGSAPEFIIVKQRDPTFSWYCYHTVIGATKAIVLNGNSTPITSTNWWNNTAPTSSVFTVQSNFNAGTPGNPYVAYLFATLDGISKVGSYTGTGNNIDVNCGFTAGARFVLIKRTDSSGDWYLFDSLRGIVGGNDPYLLLNDRAAQDTNTDYIDPLNSGFTVTSSAPAALNASGGTYVFLAIA